MRSILVRCALSLICFCNLTLLVGQAAPKAKPVGESELMALVAGNALSENIVHEIQVRGLVFHPDDIYKAQLKNAGADAALLSALDKAKVAQGTHHEMGQADLDLVAHLANAGMLIRSKKFDAATTELTAALQAGAEVEAGFVMGEALRQQEQFDFAVRVYQRVLGQDPNFPEIHTKLAFVLHKSEDQEGAMREAKLALLRNPENAEAHKNLGLAVFSLNKTDAAISEFQAALRIKPDYPAANFDLGLAYEAKHDVPATIQQYKKTEVLDRNNDELHYRLAILLKATGDNEGAIREYREVKRIAPDRVDARHNMALALLEIDPDAAIKEFHELIAMAPDFQLAHTGLGLALSHEGKLAAAEKEYRTAMAMDPTDSVPHSNLGVNLEQEKKFDAAMEEFVRAEELDPKSYYAHAGKGRIYLQRKDYPNAVRELRIAEVIKNDIWKVHMDLADALAGSGDNQGAIGELKQAETLAPENYELMSKLAPLLEKTGDKDGALQQYRLAAETGDTNDARKEYSAAQLRLKGSVSPEAAENKLPQAAPVSTMDTSDPESAWRNSMDAGTRALNGSVLTDAEKHALIAVSLAEKFPKDSRLVQSVTLLGWVYIKEKKYSDGRATWMRALSLNQELYGSESQESIGALEGVAGCAYDLKDYSAAQDFYSHAIELEEKTMGPSDHRIVSDLYWLGFSYQKAGAYAKAEPIFLKLLQMNSASAHDGLFMQGDLLIVAKLYLDWGKLDQAESYARKSLNQREQDYGSDSPMVVESLQMLADVLKKIGKPEEAAQIQKRHDTVKAASGSGFGRP